LCNTGMIFNFSPVSSRLKRDETKSMNNGTTCRVVKISAKIGGYVGCRMSDVGCRMSDVGCRVRKKKRRTLIIVFAVLFFSKISNQKSNIRNQTSHITFYSISHNQLPQQYNQMMPILFLVVSFHRVA